MTNKRTLIILGAGFSKGLTKGTQWELPTIEEFFKKTASLVWERYHFLRWILVHLFRDRLFKRTMSGEGLVNRGDFESNLGKISLEDVWDRILYDIGENSPVLDNDLKKVLDDRWNELASQEKDKARKFYSWFKDNPRAWRPYKRFLVFAEWELKNLVLKIYSNPSSLNGEQVEAIDKELGMREALAHGDSVDIITFNYDVLIEMYLEQIGESFSYQQDDENVRVRIFKPHGSLNWKRTITLKENEYTSDSTFKEKSYKNLLSENELGFFESENKGLHEWKYTEPAILPPSYEKEESYSSHVVLENPPSHSETLQCFKKKGPNAVREALLLCNQVRIVGYSFSHADALAIRVFPEVKRAREREGKFLDGLYWNLVREREEESTEESQRKDESFQADLKERAGLLFCVRDSNVKLNLEGFHVKF